MRQLIANGAKQLGLFLTPNQLNAFEAYCRELITWNQRVNLTRIIEPEDIAIKHFLDSLSVYRALPNISGPFSVIDVGTGAGFPGVPLKIALPNIRLTLLESTAKKTAFLQHIVEILQLSDTTILTARAEEAGRQKIYRERFDTAVVRAVSSLPVLAEYTLPLIKTGGTVIAQKGQHPAEELETATKSLKALGGKVSKVLPVEVPGLDAARHLVIIEKIKPTPKQYPRRPGLPAKKPL
jgi:16S rRNA (guanine527-N7)-methyltransferase